MKKSISLSVAALGLVLVSSAAFANCNGRGCDTPTTNPGNNTAYGGTGGAGGAGGNGYGGAGGSVLGSGNSSNLNSNTNQQAQGQAQGQLQGQSQNSRNSNRNDNRSNATSNATGGASNAANSNSNANSGNNSDQSVTVQGDRYDAPRIPVSTAYAPNIAPTAVCMGASSAGGSGATISLSFGTSWTDENCMKLEQARTLAGVLNDQATAAELLCDIPAIAAARSRVGKPCASAAKTPEVATVAPQTRGDSHQPKYAPAVVSQTPIVVSSVPPRVERFRVTTDGLRPLN